MPASENGFLIGDYFDHPSSFPLIISNYPPFRFLWRENATFAISRHYRRFDVFVEAEANKAAGKYDNSSIDYQVEFYKNEGLTPYSEAKLPITSGKLIILYLMDCFVMKLGLMICDWTFADVPEGCVIIREHIPITNLFSCLWFNEVDRFTARDQLSFSTVRDKIMAKVNWTVNMFLDCERRNFVIQVYIVYCHIMFMGRQVLNINPISSLFII